MTARQATRLRRVALHGHDTGLAEICPSEPVDSAQRSIEARCEMPRARASR